MIEKILSAGDPESFFTDNRVKPALLTLLIDQAKLFDSSFGEGEEVPDLRSGFPSRRALIEWYQRAAVRTLGHIADRWDPVDCMTDETLVSALVHGGTENIDPMPHPDSKRYRHLIEAEFIQPACNQAYRDLRKMAGEYFGNDDEWEAGSDEKQLDPSIQQYVAMRPGFKVLDDQQQWALAELWGGFDDEDSLLTWLHGLNSPTNGEIDQDIATSVVTDDVAMDHLVYNRSTIRARTYRELFAAKILLLDFVGGVRTTETAELAKAKRTTPQTFRMKGGQ